jgi:hypothetical protein
VLVTAWRLPESSKQVSKARTASFSAFWRYSGVRATSGCCDSDSNCAGEDSDDGDAAAEDHDDFDLKR